MSLFKKIMIPVIGGMIILGIVALFLSINTFNKFGKTEIENLRSTMISEKTEKLKNLVELAYSSVTDIYQRTDLSDADKKAAAIKLIKNMRYSEENYLWINDVRPYMVMHPITPKLDGTDLSDYEDANGKLLFIEMKKICEKNGEGTVDYYWAKPGSEKPVPKLSYVKLFDKWDWVIGTGIYIEDVDAAVNTKQEEIQATISGQRNILILALIVVIAASIAILFWITRKLILPIRNASFMLKDIAEGEGDLTRRLIVDTKDEIGEMAKWFNTFIENLQGMIGSLSQQATHFLNGTLTLSEISNRMADGSQTTSGKSKTVSNAADELNSNISSVAAAMEETTTNITMIASAAEEMSATISEIAGNSAKGNNIVSNAVKQAQGASLKVEALGRAANEIGKVNETITEISEQTNLLALNATIEAARAGEAGKGFAVVANEIKELSQQTAKATDEIKTKISSIQAMSFETVKEISGISKVINEINEIVGTIATAVEEQSVTTREIAGNVTHASQGVQEVNKNMSQISSISGDIAKEIGDVNQSASDLANDSSRVKTSSGELTKMAEQMKNQVGRFKI